MKVHLTVVIEKNKEEEMSLHRYIRYNTFIFLVVFMAACELPGNPAGAVKENHIALEGAVNMRDMGGYIGEGGKRVTYGKIFRSGKLAGLKPTDLEVLAALDIKHVIDLRTTGQLKNAPDKLPDGSEFYHLPLVANILSVGSIEGNNLEQLVLSYMMSIYSHIDILKIQSWTAIFDILETGETTLFHCTDGKDRAGMTAALVLLSLGVDKADVIEDYMMSNAYLDQTIEDRVTFVNWIFGKWVGELIRPMLGVEEEYITAFFDTIDQEYGGTDAFLAMLDVDIKAMRDHYLYREHPSCSR